MTLAATPDQRANRIYFPAVAMTAQTAAFIAELKSGQSVRCQFTALEQDTGFDTANIVWSLYAVDSTSCVAQ